MSGHLRVNKRFAVYLWSIPVVLFTGRPKHRKRRCHPEVRIDLKVSYPTLLPVIFLFKLIHLFCVHCLSKYDRLLDLEIEGLKLLISELTTKL